MVETLAHKPMIKGLNLATGTRREKGVEGVTCSLCPSSIKVESSAYNPNIKGMNLATSTWREESPGGGGRGDLSLS